MPSDRLVEAVYAHELASTARRVSDDPNAPDHGRAAVALRSCTRIGEQVTADRAEVLDVLSRRSLDADVVGHDGPRQNHEIRLRVASAEEADAAAAALGGLGYESWERWRDGALASFHHHGDHRTVARTNGHSTVVRLIWRDRPRRGALARALVPTTADWSLVSVPRWAWWIYPLVRATRLTAERVGLRRPNEHLGPFLATPASLVDALLDVAGVTDADTVVDLGCGDGRFVVAAAQRRGCRAVGIERSPELVERARARAQAVGDRVRIDLGDARFADLSEATVVFAFLPLDVVADVIAGLVTRLRPGARLVVHEQSRLPASIDPAPADSRLVLADDGVTVAHRWVVDPV